MYFAIAYDIRDDKRRSRVARLLEDYGRRVQYSVFDCNLDEARFQRLRQGLEGIVDQSEDSVRFYRLCRRCVPAIEMLGPGVYLDDDPVRIV